MRMFRCVCGRAVLSYDDIKVCPACGKEMVIEVENEEKFPLLDAEIRRLRSEHREAAGLVENHITEE